MNIQKKEEKIIEKIKELQGFMTEEELRERIRRNNEYQQKEKEIANYFKIRNMEREKLEEEMNRINNHYNIKNERIIRDKNTAYDVKRLEERKQREREKELERKRIEYEKKVKQNTYRTNERMRQRKIQMNARRMYKNVRRK